MRETRIGKISCRIAGCNPKRLTHSRYWVAAVAVLFIAMAAAGDLVLAWQVKHSAN